MNNKNISCFKWGGLGAISVLILLYFVLSLFGILTLSMHEGDACALFLSTEYSLYHTEGRFVNNVVHIGGIPYCLDFENQAIRYIDCDENHCVINKNSFRFASEYGD